MPCFQFLQQRPSKLAPASEGRRLLEVSITIPSSAFPTESLGRQQTGAAVYKVASPTGKMSTSGGFPCCCRVTIVYSSQKVLGSSLLRLSRKLSRQHSTTGLLESSPLEAVMTPALFLVPFRSSRRWRPSSSWTSCSFRIRARLRQASYRPSLPFHLQWSGPDRMRRYCIEKYCYR